MVRLLMTRPQVDSDRFLAALGHDVLAGVEVITSPLMRIEPVAEAPDIANARGLIFTSRNGVRIADALGITKDLPCYCVGAQTTALAADLGWSAHMAGENADALVARLMDQRPPAPLLHLRGNHARGDIAARLSGGGLPTKEAVIYDQVAQPLSRQAKAVIADAHPVVAPLLSPRTARQFAGTGPMPCNLWVAALSSAVADEVKHLKTCKVHVAAAPTVQSLAALVKDLIPTARRVETKNKSQ